MKPNRAFLALLVVMCAGCGAGAPAPAVTSASPAIIAAFRGDHPLARAQALQAEGRHEEAAAAARAALADDPRLADLCLDRFTLGGAEIVLTPCAPMADGARDAFLRARAQALAALPDVAYAEPNWLAEP